MCWITMEGSELDTVFEDAVIDAFPKRLDARKDYHIELHACIHS